MSTTSMPVEVSPLDIASRKRVEDSRQSRPSATERPPPRRTTVPSPRPSSSTTSAVRSLSTKPRMSYSLKICAFIGVLLRGAAHDTPPSPESDLEEHGRGAEHRARIPRREVQVLHRRALPGEAGDVGELRLAPGGIGEIPDVHRQAEAPGLVARLQVHQRE